MSDTHDDWRANTPLTPYRRALIEESRYAPGPALLADYRARLALIDAPPGCDCNACDEEE